MEQNKCDGKLRDRNRVRDRYNGKLKEDESQSNAMRKHNKSRANG